jgi:serine protease Do
MRGTPARLMREGTGAWHAVDGGALDGDYGYVFSDLDGDDGAELISADNSFLYAFEGYASHAPTRISKLIGSELRDVTHETSYQTFLRHWLQEMETGSDVHSNGYLAAWVAQKSLVGEIESAWKTMLASYDRNSDWPLEECLIDVPIDQCPDEKRRKLNFPEALAKHLIKGGYATHQELEQPGIPSGAFPQEAQAAAGWDCWPSAKTLGRRRIASARLG